MKRIVALATASVIALAAGAASAEKLMVNEIQVKSELSDITESNALQFYPTLTDDLRNAIGEQIAGQIGDSIYHLEVNLKEVSLDGAYALPGNGEFNKMEAFVSVFAEDETIPEEKFWIRLDARSANQLAALQPGTADFYNALVDAFARETAKEVAEVDVPTNTPQRIDKNEG